MKNSSEVVVIGCGIIGAAIACFLSSRGREVLLLEKKAPASGSSGACDGTVFLQSKPPGPKLEMALKSAVLYGELSKSLKYPLGYRKQGGMVLIETEEEFNAMAEIVRRQQAAGARVSLISGQEARRLQKGLSSRVAAASWCPDDGQVDPVRTTLAFLNTAVDHGCEFAKGAEATGIILKGGAVAGVRTSHGDVCAKYAVNAAGVWAPEISRMVGLDTPVVPRKGELVVSEQVEPFLSGVFLDARYIAVKNLPGFVREPRRDAPEKGVGLVLEQTAEGNLLIGSSREFAGFDRNATREAVSAILRRAVHFFPGLKSLSMIRSFAGLRPFTPDGLPYIGASEKVRGFVLAAGHEGDGIALAPETARRITEVIVSGMSQGLEEYSPDRLTP